MATAAQIEALQAAMGGPKVLVEAKAGILNLEGRQLVADKRRGIVRLVDDAGDFRLQWLTRPVGSVELNLVLLPHQPASVSKLSQCKDGRVIAFKFTDPSTKTLFFWLQEVSSDKDDEIIQKFNDTLANPPIAEGDGLGLGLPGLGANAMQSEEDMLQRVLAASAAEARASASTGAPSHSAPSSSAPARPAPTATQGNVSGGTSTGNSNSLLGQLQALAAQLNNPNAAAMREAQRPPFSLVDVLDPDRVLSVLHEDPSIIQELTPLLPESQRFDLESHLRSAQFAQTLTRIDAIASSSQYGQLLASLSLPLDTQSIGIRGFIEAIQKIGDKDAAAKQK